MLNIEKDNLNDIGGQFKLNYNIFNQYVVVSSLNMISSVVQEAI
jgi:hypothetical protein